MSQIVLGCLIYVLFKYVCFDASYILIARLIIYRSCFEKRVLLSNSFLCIEELNNNLRCLIV